MRLKTTYTISSFNPSQTFKIFALIRKNREIPILSFEFEQVQYAFNQPVPIFKKHGKGKNLHLHSTLTNYITCANVTCVT